MERFSPWSELRRFDEILDRAFRSGWNGQEGIEAWGIPVDVAEEGDTVTVTATLPGVDPSNIDVTVEDGVLTIRAETADEKQTGKAEYLLKERRVGTYYRAIRLPDSVDADRATPQYKNGVLKLTFPKLEAKKARKIDVMRRG